MPFCFVKLIARNSLSELALAGIFSDTIFPPRQTATNRHEGEESEWQNAEIQSEKRKQKRTQNRKVEEKIKTESEQRKVKSEKETDAKCWRAPNE